MGGRPICVVLLVVIGVIIWIHPLWEREDGKVYRGEEREFICQVDSAAGQGEDRSFVVRDVMAGEDKFCGKMKVYAGEGQSGMEDARIGNIYRIRGKVYSFQKAGNPGQFDEYEYYRSAGISYRFSLQSADRLSSSYDWLAHQLERIRSGFFCQFAQCLPAEEAGVLSAMILGEKCGLQKETKELYQSAGISHVLAISGLHISIIGMGLFSFLRRFVMPMRPAALVCGLTMILYGELTGFPVATERAVVMTLCLLAARFLGRRYDTYCALALSALIQLTIHPMEIFQPGFLLSYGTVFGITYFVREFQGEKIKKPVIKALRGSVGIQLVTLPVILYFYYEINPYSAVVNLVVLPLTGVLIPLAVLGGAVSVFSFPAGKFLFGTVHGILQCYDWICRAAQGLPGADLIVGRPSLWQIILYYALLVLYCHWGKRALRAALPVAAVFLLCVRIPYGTALSITNLDVGQGDCACVRLPGKTVLIDGGSSDVKEVGKYRIVPFLKFQGISRIDTIFITHPDSDHTNGLLEVLQDGRHMGLRIGSVVLPGLENEDDAYRELVRCCQNSGVRLQFMSRGDRLQVGDMLWQCGHPAADYRWASANDYSLVLSLVYNGFCGLFTGDLEESGERAILDEMREVDYLKVGHHGSKGSSSEAFLSRLCPDISVISAGENNRYGHPAEETLKRLREAGTEIFCTIDCGAVTVTADKDKYRVRVYCPGGLS